MGERPRRIAISRLRLSSVWRVPFPSQARTGRAVWVTVRTVRASAAKGGDASRLGTEERRENSPGGDDAESRGTGFGGPSGADSGATDAGRSDSTRNGSVLKRMGRVLSWPS